MVYPGRAIVRPFPDLMDFVAFDHVKWTLVVNKICRIPSRVSVPPNILIFFSVNIVVILTPLTADRFLSENRPYARKDFEEIWSMHGS